MVKLNESLTAYLPITNDSYISVKNPVLLYVGACKKDKIVLKGEQPWKRFCACIIPALIPIGLRWLLVSSDMLLDSTSFL